MMQNFNMQSFRDKLDCAPIKVSMGGISLNEIIVMTELIFRQNKVEKMYVCTDLVSFRSTDENAKMRIPFYLLDDNPFNDYRYLLGYETWMRFLPVSVAINTLNAIGMELPGKASRISNIDYLEYWNDDFAFGEDVVISNYVNSRYSVSVPELDGLYERMTQRFDEYISVFDSTKEYVFFFPPYSALFWYQAKSDGYYDIYLDAKTYMVGVLSDKENVVVYDFQSMPLICDLNNYKDTSHYTAEINEIMVDCFVNGDYIVNAKTISDSIDNLGALVTQFEQDNSQWLIRSPSPGS